MRKNSFKEIVSDFYKQNTLERLLEKIIMRAVDINHHLLLKFATEDIKTPKICQLIYVVYYISSAIVCSIFSS